MLRDAGNLYKQLICNAIFWFCLFPRPFSAHGGAEKGPPRCALRRFAGRFLPALKNFFSCKLLIHNGYYEKKQKK